VALLRGVNVGGARRIAMAELRAALSAAGFDDVRTHIQSGNVVLDVDEDDRAAVAASIARVIDATFGLAPAVFALTVDELEAAIAADPFGPRADAPQHVHFYFLATPAPDADLGSLRELAVPGEEIELTDAVLYVHTPAGIGRSRMASRIERLVPTETTARNLRTIQAVRDLARTSGAGSSDV
jgi:uncharacterized protein (DUF1697 family)